MHNDNIPAQKPAMTNRAQPMPAQFGCLAFKTLANELESLKDTRADNSIDECLEELSKVPNPALVEGQLLHTLETLHCAAQEEAKALYTAIEAIKAKRAAAGKGVDFL